MRTTLTIDDDVLEVARCMAEAQGISLGQAISRLAKRGMRPIGLRESPSGLMVFDIDPDEFPPVTDEDVRRILADFP